MALESKLFAFIYIEYLDILVGWFLPLQMVLGFGFAQGDSPD